jgi:hypothetical protein
MTTVSADTVKNPNLPSSNPGTASSPKQQVKDFNEAFNRSTDSNGASGKPGSQNSQGTSEPLPILLAGRPPGNRPGPSSSFVPNGQPTGTQGAPLYQSTGAGSTAGPQVAAPATPGKPLDVVQMETLNRRVQAFNVAGSPLDPQDLKDGQKHFQEATKALKAGDYKKAESELSALGFPLPPGGGQLSNAATVSAALLGVPVRATGGGGWQMAPVSVGAHGNQALNDMNGFAANAAMINRLASAPGGVSNPPTEAQVTQYMRDLANPPKGQQPTAQQVMQASSEITGGMIMHYSSAGRNDPVYNANPNPRAFYKDSSGQTHEFASVADAQKAAKAKTPPIAPGTLITRMDAKSPDQWSDVSSQGAPRAGRVIGDCESKLYVQTRLLTEAGFTSLGSVDVQHAGGIGHMFGAFKAPDGTTWVTSNEQFRQVIPSDPKVGVTQADLDGTLQTMTQDLYHVQNLNGFTFSAAATANLPTAGNPAVDSIRRSTELGMMGRTEDLIPPPPPPVPAQVQATPAAGSVQPRP